MGGVPQRPARYRPLMNQTSSQSTPVASLERVPLARLARTTVSSPALARIVANGAVERGPGRVAVAAFQSSV